MYNPTLTETSQSREMLSVFGGYNHNRRISDGEFYDMTNLTSSGYPLLMSRPARGRVQQLTVPGGMLAKDAMAVVDGGKLYYNGKEITGLTLSDGDKQMVSMGAYLVIWPDKVYLNTKDVTDCGSLEASWESTGNVVYSLSTMDGKAMGDVPLTQPENPTGGEYWIDTTQTPHQLMTYSASQSMWTGVATVYTKISADGIGKAFAEGDGLEISGIAYGGDSEAVKAQYEDLNGTKVVQSKGDGWIVVIGLIDLTYTQESGTVKAARSVPDMDYVCEAQNRIWGCKYGMVDGKTVNELYCCKLGDFKNWRVYAGVSTDAWAASVGSDGAWTGAINYQGYPTFFKEDVIHRISVASSGGHQVVETAARGVQNGSWRSLCVVNEMLLYKSRTDVCAYDGSFPTSIGAAFGDVLYSKAAAGCVGGKYYISMYDGSAWHLFVYDANRAMWHREDNTHALVFARMDDDLFYIDADTKWMMCVNGTQGTLEDAPEWSAETGVIGYDYPDKKYLSRYNIRLQIEQGGELRLYCMYDSDGIWREAGTVRRKGHGTFTVPVIPRRCDHMRLKLSGKGVVRVFSIAKILELGSDLGW